MNQKLNIGCIILAGGKSKRMGRDKSLIEYHGKAMLEYLVYKMVPLFGEVLVVVDDKNKKKGICLEGATVVEDLIQNSGPLAGVYTGLCHSTYATNCVLTCDMPEVNQSLIQTLYEFSEESYYDGYCFHSKKGGLQPFPGIYQKNARFLMRVLLDQNEYAMQRFFDFSVTRNLQYDPVWDKQFVNVNTQEDYQKAVNQ